MTSDEEFARRRSENDQLRARSGNVTNRDRLAGFLYELMRDYVTPGKIEELVRNLPKPGEEVKYTNGWLASYCEDVAKRIIKETP